MAYAETVQALVISRRSVGEADRLVTLFTREKGLIRVLAKGVRKIPSRRGGHLEPLTRVRASVAGHAGRLYLADIETRDYLTQLHQKPGAVASAQSLAQALTGLFEYEVAYPRVYDRVRHAWEGLGADQARRDLLEITCLAYLLREAGVMPSQLAARLRGQLTTSEEDLAKLARSVRLYAAKAAFAVHS